VYSAAHTLRIREQWQSTSYRSEPVLTDDTAVSRFERMISRLSLLQSQLPPRYHTAAMLADKILNTVRGEWLAASLLAGAAYNNPPELAAQAKLLLATDPPGIRTPAALSPPAAPPVPPAAAFLASTPAPDVSRPLFHRYLDRRRHHPGRLPPQRGLLRSAPLPRLR